MGKNDTLTKQYLAQNDIFADAFNFYMFNGEQVIKAKDLKEQDPTELAVINKMGKVFTNQKIRDVLKLCTIRHSKLATLVLLGIEGQSDIHYAMPVRDYLYDALNYASQVEFIRKRHEEGNDLTGAEKLSGFSKSDHIIPVITLCICFDKKAWDAPRCLYDMFRKVDPRIRNFVDDYNLNLITPSEIEDFSRFTSELGFVLEFIHNSDDKQRLRDIIEARKDENVDIRTVEMINTYTGADISTKNAKGGQIRVCQALKEIMNDERTEGRAEGRAEGLAEGADMLASLLKAIAPGSKDFEKALNATDAERRKLYKKYGISK
ncbi:MAG: transposase [Oribacterium sp.]|nr:transposase [Oribacterium sp.]